MKYWFTTHWPPLRDGIANSIPSGIWLPDGKLQAADGMRKGDLVFIYELKSGRSLQRNYADGSMRTIKRHEGQQGVVVLAQIIEPLYQPENNPPEKYADGSELWWRYFAPTVPINSAGFISRVEAAKVFGYREGCVFRGFGKDHSGLKELTQQQFKDLERLYIKRAESADAKTKQKASSRMGLPHGEGPTHRELKRAIARDPAGMLKEAGLQFWAEEYCLPTGDRMDVVLKDRHGRFVIVEVEVDCEATELIGPLQCVKYRALMSYLYERPLAEVRTILVAHSIHPVVFCRCEKSNVSCRVVDRTAMKQRVSKSQVAPRRK